MKIKSLLILMMLSLCIVGCNLGNWANAYDASYPDCRPDAYKNHDASKFHGNGD